MGNIIMGPINVMIGNVLTIVIIALIIYYVVWELIVKKVVTFFKKFFTDILKPIVEEALDKIKDVGHNAVDGVKNLL